MSGAAAAAPAPAAPSRAVESSADDTALFAKYTAQHQAEVAKELGEPSAPTPRSKDASPAKPDEAKPDDEVDDPSHADEGSTDDDADGAERRGAADGKKPDAAASGVTADVDAARAAWAKGDTKALDAALKKILPGSKGLAEFTVDGKRWNEVRTVVAKRKAELDTRAAELDTREGRYKQGMAMLDSLVQRYEPIEKLVQLAESGDVDAFVELVEKTTKKSLNDTVKRHLDRKLGKPEDPHLSALERELKAEREARQALERKLDDDKRQTETNQKIQRHLVFLNDTLKGHEDPAVRALVASPAGMRAIFEAQRAAYDSRTDRTLTPAQAALQVIAAKRRELEPWVGLISPTPPDKALPAAAPPAPAPRGRSLNNRGGGASSAGRRLTDNEMFEKYERMAKMGGD